jgi:hypothetical protein
MLADLSDFIARLWTIAGETLRLNPDVLMHAASSPQGNLLIATMTVVAGASLLAGQSVILFVNQVSRRFACCSRIVFALSLGPGAAMVGCVLASQPETNQPLKQHPHRRPEQRPAFGFLISPALALAPIVNGAVEPLRG